MSALLLVALVGCWTGYAAPEQPQPRAVRRVVVKPVCWSVEFYEQWPADLVARDVTAECWESDPDRVDACVATRYWYAYQRLLSWTQRWFEDCDPGR